MIFDSIQSLVQCAQLHPEQVYFTSDTHFGHARIIELCNRPFSSVEEMNNTLIENWNKTVGEGDIVFHLGDFCFGDKNLWQDIRSRLNGSICLIRGNHDDHNLKPSTGALFNGVSYQLRLKLEDKTVYLNHYPFLCYGGSWREDQSTWQLFGHVHSHPGSTGIDNQRLVNLFPTQYDVGVDNNNFTPVSWEQIKNIIAKQIQHD